MGALLCLVVALCGGCPGSTPPPDNGNGNGEEPPDEETAASIVSPTTGFGMSALDEPVSVLYNVDEAATNVRGFYFEVSDGSLDSAPLPGSERVITAAELEVGTHQAFSFDPAEAGVGYFRVGIVFDLGGVEEDVESRAVIHVEGSPDPLFILPDGAVTEVERGSEVFISFDVRDPEENAQWRLFYLIESDSRLQPADQLGTQLATGSGNAGTFTFPTSGLDPGDYQVGISATDSGSSVAGAVASGDSDRIVTIPNLNTTTPIIRVVEATVAKPPTIAVTAPATNVTLDNNDTFTIRFSGAIKEPDASGTIEVFYDLDNNVGNGFTTIQADLPATATSAVFPAGVLAGTYYVGATIWDGINPAVTAYATGRITVEP